MRHNPLFNLASAVLLISNLLSPLAAAAAEPETGQRWPLTTAGSLSALPGWFTPRAAEPGHALAALPGWFVASDQSARPPQAARALQALPAWFASPDGQAQRARPSTLSPLPAWFGRSSRLADEAAAPSMLKASPPASAAHARSDRPSKPGALELAARPKDLGAAAPQGSAPAQAAPSALPAWFDAGLSSNGLGVAPVGLGVPLSAADFALTHHTIYTQAVTVTVSPASTFQHGQMVTFTIVAHNDISPTTNVVLTSTMPAGFQPAQWTSTPRAFSPNETYTYTAVFTATNLAVSGQNVVTLTQASLSYPVVKTTDFTVSPDIAAFGVQVPQYINNCEPVTVAVVLTNSNPFTDATGIVISSSMPDGFVPQQQVLTTSLAAGASATKYLVFTSTCSAVSGQNTVTITQDGYAGVLSKLTSFVVNPGAITLVKDPAVIPAKLGDTVTWTVYVQSTGYGTVHNVAVTDTLGAGLKFVTGTQSAFFDVLTKSQTVSFTISARVIQCSGLENHVVATWGCDLCQLQTAKASIDLKVQSPALDFHPPVITVDYCSNSGAVSMPIANTGGGDAHNVFIGVDLSPLVVTSVSVGAVYTTLAGLGPGFLLSDVIPGGGGYTLTYNVALPPGSVCSAAGGNLTYQPRYYDDCGNPYTFFIENSPWQRGGVQPALSTALSGLPAQMQVGDIVTTLVSVNIANLNGSATVTDALPAGWTPITYTGNALVTSTAGITVLVWSNLTSSNVFTVVLQSPNPQTAGACAYCGTLAHDQVSARAADCQNCSRSSTTDAYSEMQCSLLVAGAKEVSPALADTCSAYVYTNTYTFDSSFPATSWSSMRLTETMANGQDYFGGPLSATVLTTTGSVTYAYPLTVNYSKIGGRMVLTFSGGVTVPVAGSMLIVAYELQTTINSASACQNNSWFDWTDFNTGAASNGPCGQGAVVYEGVQVGSQVPQMTLDVSGLPANVSSCGVYAPVLTVNRTTPSIPAYDAVVDVPTNTYRILSVTGFTGSAPTLTTTDAAGYHFYYSDTFTSATGAAIDLIVQLKCSAASAPFTATVSYDNACGADGIPHTPGATCQAGVTGNSNPVVLKPYLVLYKFPEVIYAADDVVTWTLTALNSGSGIAYGVDLTDALGTGLMYLRSTITSDQGSAAGVTPITSTNVVTWPNLTIKQGEKYTIQYAAQIIGCTDLTNAFGGQSGCLGNTCETEAVHTSTVELPPTVLLNTNQLISDLGTCLSRTVTATVRNAGLLSVYDTSITETLPSNMFYIPGSTEVVTGTTPNPPATGWIAGGEPDNSIPNTLVWKAAQIANLSRVYPSQTIWVRFAVRASCNFNGGNVTIQASYHDTCASHTSTASDYATQSVQPGITVSKIGQNLTHPEYTAPGKTVSAQPGDTIVWTVQVNKPGAVPAFNVLVTDVLPVNVDSLITVTSSPSIPYTQNGSTLLWDIDTLTQTTWTALVTTTVAAAGCALADTGNVVTVTSGCDDGCRQIATDHWSLRTRPSVNSPAFLTAVPGVLPSCGGVFTLTVANAGPPAYNVVLTDSLPAGFQYAALISATTAPSVSLVGGAPVFTWVVLPSGDSRLALQVNSGTAGQCAALGPTAQNVVTLTYQDVCDDVLPPAAAKSNITIAQPALVIDKLPYARVASPGELVSWTITLNNNGNGDAPNVVVTDTLGSGLAAVSASDGVYGGGNVSAVIDTNVITWTPGFTLTAGDSWTAIVTATALAGGSHVDTASASGSCAAGCTYAATSQPAYISLFDTFSKGPKVQTQTIGSQAVFTFVASLPGLGVDYGGLMLTDTLPAGLAYDSSIVTTTSDSGASVVISTTPSAQSGNSLIWAMGDLTGVVRIQGAITTVVRNIPANHNGVAVTNLLSMTYTDTGVPYAFTDTAQVDIVEPSVTLAKSASSSTGSTGNLDGSAFLTYTLWLANNGTSPAYDVFVTDSIPAGISVTAQFGAYPHSLPVQGPGILTWTVDSIDNQVPNNAVALTYTAVISGAASGETLTNTAHALYHSLPGGPPEVRTYPPLTASQAVSTSLLTTAKGVVPASSITNHLRIGDLVTYTIVVTVPAAEVAYWPSQTDVLPLGFHFVPGSLAARADPSLVFQTGAITLTVPVTSATGGAERIGWLLNTVTNTSETAAGLITATFQARITGRNTSGADTADTSRGDNAAVNIENWSWTLQDTGSYTPALALTRTASVTSQVSNPRLGIVKTATPAQGAYVGANDPITYTLVVTNDGRAPAYDIVISDTLPGGIYYTGSTLASSTPPTAAIGISPTFGATGLITWTVNLLNGLDLSASPRLTLTVNTAVVATIAANQRLTNTAGIPYYDSQPGDVTQRIYSDGSSSTWHRTVNAGITKTVMFSPPPTATLGSLVTYTLSIPPSPITATLNNVRVTDTIRSTMALVSAIAAGGVSPSAGWSGQVVTATFASIPDGEQGFVTITAIISNGLGANAGTAITNSATMSFSTASVVTTTQVVTTVVGEPSLTIAKASQPPTSNTVAAGQAVTYSVTITNLTGPNRSPAYSLLFTDTLPIGMRATTPFTTGLTLSGADVAPSNYVTGYDPTSGLFTITFSPAYSVPVGSRLVITYLATVDADVGVRLDLTNQARAAWTSVPLGRVGLRNYATGVVSTTVHTVAPAISKTVTPAVATLGTVLTYTIAVPSTPITASIDNAVVTDVVDARLRLQSVITDGVDGAVSQAGNAFTVTYGSPIATLTQRLITATAVLSDPLLAQAGNVIPNLGVLSHAAGITVSNQPAFTVIEPHLVISKTDNVPPGSTVLAGQQVTYTVRLTNTSVITGSPAYSLAITDTLPFGMRQTPPVVTGLDVNGVSAGSFLTGYTPAFGLLTVTLPLATDVDRGQVLVLTYNAQVDADVPASLPMSNLVSATYTSLPSDVPGIRTYGPITASTPLTTPAPTTLLKAVAPPTVSIGSPVVFTLTVPGAPLGATLYHVTVTDQVDSRLQIVAVTPSGGSNGHAVFAGQNITVTFDNVPDNTQATILVSAIVSDQVAVSRGVQIPNVASMDYSGNPAGPIPSNIVTVTVAEPDVSVAKTVLPLRNPAGAGDVVTYQLALNNSGDWPAYDLHITDTLPAGLSFVAATGLTVTDPLTDVTGTYPVWGVPQLNPGGSVFITFTARVSPAIGAGVLLTNTAQAEYDGQPGTPPVQRIYQTPPDTATIQSGQPALQIVKTAAPTPVPAGDPLTYTLTATNTGLVSATGAIITDLMPLNTSYLSCGPASTGCGYDGVSGVVSWSLGTLDIGLPRTVTMEVNVNSPLVNGTLLTNTAVVTCVEGISATTTLTTPVVSSHSLAITKTVSALTIEAGSLLTYTLNWSLSGNEPAFGVILTDAVPANTAFVSASAPYAGPSGGVITWTLGNLNPAATGTVTFTVGVSTLLHNGTQIVNTAFITDSQGISATSSATTTLLTPLVLGNQVWFDVNDNGQLDAGEAGVSGLAVELHQDTNGDAVFTPGVDQLISTTTTDAGGYYTFTNLLSSDFVTGTYLIVITSTNFASGGPLVDYRNSEPAVAGNSDLNNWNHGYLSGTLGSGGYVASTPVSLTVGMEPINDGDTNPNTNLTIDFGFYKLSVGNQVWLDADNNGLLDGTEAGLPGVTVHLYDSSGTTVLSTTTTDSGGFYTFTNIISGTYVVGIVPPANYTACLPVATSANPGNNWDSDSNGVNLAGGLIRTNPFTLTAGDGGVLGNNSVITGAGSTSNPTIDFGVLPTLSLGNQVWYDVNDNGQLNAGEAGVPGVAIELYRDTNGDGVFTPGMDQLVATTTTGPGGYYTFTNLFPANYLVVITATNFLGGGALVNYRSSDLAVGGNSGLDNWNHGVLSGTLGSGGYVASTAVSMTVGGTNPNLTVDFGFYQLSLGNQVWYDNNHNGLLDAGEAPAPGIPVTLTDATGVTVVATTTTDVNGIYTFTGLLSGTYEVEIGLPPGFTNTVITTTSANPNNNVDGDNNGVNVGSGTVGANAVSLRPGDAGTLHHNVVVTATGSTYNPTVDFGLYSPVALGNQVWYDVNDNSQLDAGEAGVPGVVVQLYRDKNGDGRYTPGVDQFLSTTTTDANGFYNFNNLTPTLSVTGTYLVVITATNFSGSGPLVYYHNDEVAVGGNSDLNDWNHGYLSGTLGSGGYVASTPVSLTVGGEPVNDGDTNPSTNLTLDFGFYRLSVGNQVWHDSNNDGLLDFGETGMPSVTVRLYNGLGTTVLSTTTTDASGFYTFTNIISGTYVIGIVPPATYTASTPIATSTNPANNGDGDSNGVNLAGGLIRTNPFTLTAGDSGALGNNSVITATGWTFNPTIDFGLYTPPGISLRKALASGQPAYLGDLVTFTIRITNTGVTSLTVVPLTDTFDSAYLSPVGAGPASDVTGTNQLLWTNVLTADLLPGRSVTVSVVMRAVGVTPPGSPTINTAVTGGDIDINGQQPPGGSSSSPVPITIVPGLAISKRVLGSPPFKVGSELTFTIQITNLGSTAFITLPLADTYDTAYLGYVRAIPSPDAVAPGRLDWYNLAGSGGLLPHTTLSVQVVFTAVAAVTNTINTATVSDAIGTYGTTATVSTTTGIPTAITLEYFRIDGENGNKVQLSWATAVEINNFGFNIYRAPADDPSQRTVVHFESSVAPGGSNHEEIYHYTDIVPSQGVWWYWLSDIDRQTGVETFHGPIHTAGKPGPDLPYTVYLPLMFNQR